jgi:2-keto-4-pentenoate hydratase/2-oxohepta-3-ene-1,7-dioic acid hydratase in catechol pathway
MKIVRYRYKHEEYYGFLEDGTLFCLPALAELFDEELPSKLEDFINCSNWTLKVAEDLFQKTRNRNVETVSIPLKDAVLLAPIAYPPKIICLGRNYVDHSAEMKAPVPEEPVIFMKPHTAIIGSGDKIIKPSMVKELDYEGELAVVIGKKAKNLSVSNAESVIFGYTVFNDVSARDYQFKDGQWTRGKSFDTFAPTGPCVVTAAQLPDTGNLQLRTWVNGELRQNATTGSMGLNVSQIVHHLSRVMTLEPCDIIATGTPSGVGFAMKPPKFLKHGDVVRIEIEGIGVLENTVEEVVV